MRKLITSVVLQLITLVWVAAEDLQKQENFHLYLLIGQSNMAGRAQIPEDATADIPNTLLLNNEGEWVPAANPLNQYSTIRKKIEMQKLGPGYAFAKSMQAAAGKEITLGLVVNARGGTKIDAWQKGQPYYTDAVARMKIAQQTGTLKGIIWHQGEGNKNDSNYLTKLTKLINAFRKDLDTPNLAFVVGQVTQEERYTVVNEQLAKVPEHLSNTACVSSKDLTTQDGTHFDSASQIEFGERYAKAMQKLQAKK